MTPVRPRSLCSLALVCAAVCASVVMPCAAAPAPMQASKASVPDTTHGKCAKAFIDVINNPTVENVTAFEKAWASSKRAGSRSMQDRADGLAEMKTQHGSYTIVEVVDASESSLSMMVEDEHHDAMLFEFNFNPDEAGKLDAVMISSGGGAAMRPETVNAAARREIIDGVLNALREGYVYPEVAEKMAAAVETKVAAGEYDRCTTDVQLTQKLTQDLREVSKDGHLGVRIAPAPPPSAQEQQDEMGPTRDMMRRNNYGFRKTELLPGNIGYLRFDFFAEDDEAKQLATAALAFMQHADALIFDMRYNGGGSPEMIRYITSYLFDQPTHLNSMIDRNGDVVEEFWTLENVPGPATRFANDLPIYVLTSNRTFSGAEEFSYNLKNLKRGVIVGETTGGGAHPVMGDRVSDRVVVMVPYMRANNPISKTNWEGTGVAPDVACKADDALDTATKLAKEAIERRHSDKD